MSRRLLPVVVLVLAAAPVRAQDPPELLLSPTSQFYIKWDGIGGHKQAYQASIWGSIMAGPTGDTIRAELARGPKLLGSALLAEPLLEGHPPEELQAVHTDLKKAEKLIDLIADQGIVVSAEVTEPRPTLAGVGKAIGGLLSRNAVPPASFVPDARVFIIVPDVGDRAEVLFGAFRLLGRKGDNKIQPLPATLGRTGFMFTQPDPNELVHAAWWIEGKHFVLYAGTAPVDTAVNRVRENAAAGGVTTNPLFKRTQKTGDFESVARGYVDTGAVLGLAKRLAGPFVPGLSEKLDAIGLGNLKAIVFSSGFQGKESRALYEFDLPGERSGLAKVLKSKPVTPDDLPPLPPDVSRFSMMRVDFTGAFDAGLTAIDSLVASESFGVEEQAKTQAEISRLRREFLERELTKAIGVNVREELLPYLGDKVVIFQSPTEGLSVFGTVLCISVKNPGKIRSAVDRMNRGLQAVASGPLKVRKKMLAGIELREVYSRGFGILTPTYAVVGDWLVIAGHPQPVQGLILRHQGKLDRWKPDAETAARLAKMPADAIGLQYCDPRSTVQNLCCVGPLFVSTLGLRLTSNNETEFDPPDTGLVPNGHELSKHLFPNLTYTRDDGKTVRVEVNESLSLPLEFLGFEPLIFGGTIGLFTF